MYQPASAPVTAQTEGAFAALPGFFGYDFTGALVHGTRPGS